MKHIITYIFFIILLGLLYFDNVITHKEADLNRMRAESYARANGKNIARIDLKKCPMLYAEIQDEIGIPKELLQAIKIHENGSRIMEFGCKKVPLAALKKSPLEWQARGAAKVVIEEAFECLMSDPKLRIKFFKILGSRYCEHDKDGWSSEVMAIYLQLKESEI